MDKDEALELKGDPADRLLDEAVLYIIEKRYPDEATENRKRIIKRKRRSLKFKTGSYNTLARVKEERLEYEMDKDEALELKGDPADRLLDEAVLYIIEKRYPDEATENRKRIIKRKRRSLKFKTGSYNTLARVKEER